MSRRLLKISLLTVTAASALVLSSCNTMSGFGRDLQNASDAVQGY